MSDPAAKSTRAGETRAYRGKIGRMPHTLRREICERMRDGATAAAIIDWLGARADAQAVLKEHGFGPVIAQNITEWRQGGYQDWLKGEERTEHMRKLTDLSESILGQTGGDPSAVGSRLLAGRLLDVLAAADGADDGAGVAELAKTVATLRGGDLLADRLRLDRDRLDVQRRALDLDRERFLYQVADKSLKLFEDTKAREIAEGDGDRGEKLEKLLAYMRRQEEQGDAT